MKRRGNDEEKMMESKPAGLIGAAGPSHDAYHPNMGAYHQWTPHLPSQCIPLASCAFHCVRSYLCFFVYPYQAHIHSNCSLSLLFFNRLGFIIIHFFNVHSLVYYLTIWHLCAGNLWISNVQLVFSLFFLICNMLCIIMFAFSSCIISFSICNISHIH